jgi:hypothetical protein
LSIREAELGAYKLRQEAVLTAADESQQACTQLAAGESPSMLSDFVCEGPGGGTSSGRRISKETCGAAVEVWKALQVACCNAVTQIKTVHASVTL